ncbi:hypothetical protein G9A89_009530 [Geosiphon pyriformis]|nr:hypothetical protein G9A89_009530 [Geosiphon pyriformis]
MLDWNMQELQLSQNGQHMRVPVTCGHFKPNNIMSLILLINFEKEKPKPTWEAYQKGKEKEEDLPEKADKATEKITSGWEKEYLCEPMKTTECKLTTTANHAIENTMITQNDKWNNKPCFAYSQQLLNEGMWNDIPSRGEMCDTSCQYTILISNWKVTHTMKTKSENSPEEFHEHYQNLAPTKEEQEKRLEEINTQLCDHCLISCNFQYCNECELIYNLPPCMIYTIPEKKKPISSCASESESIFNPNSNSDKDDDKNTNLIYKQYIVLSDLTKKQELKWFSDNNKGIMPEHVHDIDARFDLRYPGKEVIKLELLLHTCINLKVALEIPATTIVQLASRSSLAKRRINIRGGIINVEYVGNIIIMLQNDSEKAYIIEPNEKIAQAIFLPLLGITAREIQGFGSTCRIDVPVNMVEKEIVGQEKIISIGQAIFILLYDQYMVEIERKVKDQNQIFEAEASLCKSEEIGLINLHIPAKNYSCIKIPIYNNTGSVVQIPEGTTIGYLTTEIENQPPSTIPDFSQLCGYVDITSQTIYR